MTSDAAPNRDQVEFWNSASGRKWVDHQGWMDETLGGVLDCLLESAALRSGEVVLDVGCGTGATTLAAAVAVGPEGRAEGVDISTAMVDRARARAAEAGIGNVAFRLCDAQTHAFAEASYDVVVSRFGMMFFDSPVAAFANIARALAPGGRMTFLAWAGIGGNPWFALPRQAAIDRLGVPAPTDPSAPGPLAFQDRGRVAALMAEAGLAWVSAEEITVELAPPGSVEEVARLATLVGPAARILRERGGSEDDARAIEAAVARAIQPFAGPGGLRIPATLNSFSARRS